jgi:hypothetical protein
MPPISSRVGDFDLDASSVTVAQERATQISSADRPMPTEGMRGIAAICEQAATSASALAQAARGGGLGNVIAGNNATMMPPPQQISGMNSSGLAGLVPLLAGVIAAATSQHGGQTPAPNPPSSDEGTSPASTGASSGSAPEGTPTTTSSAATASEPTPTTSTTSSPETSSTSTDSTTSSTEGGGPEAAPTHPHRRARVAHRDSTAADAHTDSAPQPDSPPPADTGTDSVDIPPPPEADTGPETRVVTDGTSSPESASAESSSSSFEGGASMPDGSVADYSGDGGFSAGA